MVHAPPRLSIALISASAIAYEILLMKLFSIIQWHHFAYMIISLALLGYGASGTFLALLRERLLKHFSLVYLANILLFALSTIFCFLLAQQIPFNPLLIFWESAQLLWLSALYLLLALPFFFVANAIGLAMIRFKEDISRIYGADMVGAGLGGAALIALLYLLFPISALLVIALTAMAAAAVALKELSMKRGRTAVLLFVSTLLIVVVAGRIGELHTNDYKDLSQTLRIAGTKIVDERSSPLGTISVVESPEVPFRYAPGLSIASEIEPPLQLGIFTNGDGMSAITQFPEKMERVGYLDYQTSSLAYHLADLKSVLVLGAGGGSDILQALYHGVKGIDGVEIDPMVVELVGNTYAEYAGNIYTREGVRVETGEARGYITTSGKEYDLIQISMLDSFGASSAGLYALSENYLYTVEALQLYLKHLKPGGYLSISRWLKLPPRDTLKLFATAVEALERNGVKEPRKQLLLIRGWQTATLVVKNGAFASDEIERAKRFADERFFDRVFYDGLNPSELNRHNILEKPFFYEGATNLLADAERFYDDYKFNIEPATDDKPYFYHFFKWKSFEEIVALSGSGGLPLLEWGYLVLVASLLQAVIASVVLILLPLLRYRGVQTATIAASKTKVMLYFVLLGLGFIFLEIYFIQRFILFLHHPIYTVAIVLSAFLVFAGLGSIFSKRLSRNGAYLSVARYAVYVILLLGVLYLLGIEQIFGFLMTQPMTVKVVASFIMIAPLAFAMGMPFPMGLSELGRHSEPLIPWAWGVNGCASVISAIAATLTAIHFGFTVVMIASLLFYLAASLTFPVQSVKGR